MHPQQATISSPLDLEAHRGLDERAGPHQHLDHVRSIDGLEGGLVRDDQRAETDGVLEVALRLRPVIGHRPDVAGADQPMRVRVGIDEHGEELGCRNGEGLLCRGHASECPIDEIGNRKLDQGLKTTLMAPSDFFWNIS